MASLAGALFAAVMAYAMWLMYRLLNRKRLEKDGRRIKNVIFDVGNVLVDYDLSLIHI